MDKKEEKKKVLKARDIVGTNYFIIILLLSFISNFFLEKVLSNNESLLNTLSLILNTILPFVGVCLLKKLSFKKLKSYITQENYKKVRNYTILYLIVIGVIYMIGYIFSKAMIIVLIGYVLSSIYLINEMNKLSKEV